MNEMPWDQKELDAAAERLAPAVHAALDRRPPEVLTDSISAAASRRRLRRAHGVIYLWRGLVSVAATLLVIFGLWSIREQRHERRLRLLDDLLVLASWGDPEAEEIETGSEDLAERLMRLQGFDADVIIPEPAESPELPAIDVRSRSTFEHHAKRYG
jgi:hypothetical protein